MLWYVLQQNHNAGQGNGTTRQDIREIQLDHREGFGLLFQATLESHQILIESKRAKNRVVWAESLSRRNQGSTYLIWIRVNWFQSNMDIWETFSQSFKKITSKSFFENTSSEDFERDCFWKLEIKILFSGNSLEFSNVLHLLWHVGTFFA